MATRVVTINRVVERLVKARMVLHRNGHDLQWEGEDVYWALLRQAQCAGLKPV